MMSSDELLCSTMVVMLSKFQVDVERCVFTRCLRVYEIKMSR